MAENIRGISVVIGSDTTGLSKALSDVNKNARDIQSELKQVEKLLKLDPTNTELVAQKQKLLSDAIANTGEKLNRLKAAQEQVNDQFKKGDITEGQYRAFQREIAAAEQALGRFEDQAKGTKKTLADVGKTAQETGEKIKGAGEKISVAITAPIVAAGALMAKGAMDAENATGKLQAQLGLTAEEAADLGAVAQTVWINGFGENIGEATDAIKLVRQNMKIMAEDELQKVTEAAMTISDLFEGDVRESTAAAGVMMKNFGIDGQTAMDLMTVGFQRGGDYSGELLDTLREYSPQFATLGLNAEQMMGILVAGAQAGAWNLDKVGDAVKEFNIRAQDGSKTTADGFAAIGLSADQMGQAIAQGGEKGQQAFTATIAALAAMKDPVQQNIAGVALFGTQWEDLRGQVVTAMADGVKGIGDFKGASDAAAKAAYDNNPALALTMAMRELQAAIGPALLPLADIIKNTVVPAIKEMADWFKNLSPEGQKVALAVAAIAAAIGPLLIVAGSLAGIFSSLAIAAGAMGITIGALVAPVAIAVAAIATLVTAGVLLYKNWDTIKGKASEIWEGIKNYFSEVFGEISRATSDAWDEFKDGILKTWDSIKSKTTEIWNGIKKFLADWWPLLIGATAGPIGILAGLIYKNWDQIKAKTTEIWNSIKAWMYDWWDNITSWLSSWDPWGSVSVLWDAFKTNIITVFRDLGTDALNWGANIIQGLWTGISNMGSTFAANLRTWINEHIPAVVRDVLDMHSPSQVMIGIGKNIVEGLAGGVDANGNLVTDQMVTLLNAVKTKCEDIVTLVNDLQNNVARNPIVIPVEVNWPTGVPVGGIVPGVPGGGGSGSSGGGGSSTPSGVPSGGIVPGLPSSGTTPGGIVPGLPAGGGSMSGYTSMPSDSSLNSGFQSGVTYQFAEGGIATKPTLGILAEAGYPEAVLPLPRLLPMMTEALLGAVKSLSRSSVPVPAVGGQPIVQVINHGTIVGRNGMEEFADIVSQRIGRKFGLSTGGVF